MNRTWRGAWSVALVLGLLATAGLALVLLGGHGTVRAAPAQMPAMQGVQASGILTWGRGTCFPDAVLTDCDGNMTKQLKGPGGSGFFSPYIGQWVTVDGAEMTCVAGDKYIQVVSIQTQPNPCPGQGTPSATPTPGTPGPTSTTAPPGASPTPPPPPGVTPTATPPVSGTVNLALGKAVQVSSAPDPAHPGQHAVDGDAVTYWASIPDPQPVWHVRHVQWIYVDLGSEYPVERMRMLWNEHARPRKYAIYVWQEWCRGWNLVAWTERGKADDPVQFPRAVDGRYFMLWLEVPFNAGSNYELREWEVYGPSSPIQSTNIAAGKPSLAQSHQPGYEAQKANDADLASEWRSSVGLPQWIYIDLQSSYQIDRAILRWVPGMHATEYALYAWDGFATWIPVYATTRGVGGDETVTFRSVRTRYFLLNAVKGPANAVGIREFEIYQPKRPGGGLPHPILSQALGARSSASWVYSETARLSSEATRSCWDVLSPGDSAVLEAPSSGLTEQKISPLRPLPDLEMMPVSPVVTAPDPTR